MAPYRWTDCPPQAPQASPFGALPVHRACVDYADPGQRSSSASSWDGGMRRTCVRVPPWYSVMQISLRQPSTAAKKKLPNPRPRPPSRVTKQCPGKRGGPSLGRSSSLGRHRAQRGRACIAWYQYVRRFAHPLSHPALTDPDSTAKIK